jgi:hypothetical protein
MERLTNDQPQVCRLTLRCKSDGGVRFPGSSLTATIQAPDTIACNPSQAQLVLDDSGGVVWLVEMRLTRKDVRPGREKVTAIFQHESGLKIDYSFDVDVGR